MKKHNPLIRIIRKFAIFNKKLEKKSPVLFNLLLILLCFGLTIPFLAIAKSGILRTIDFTFEDTCYQNGCDIDEKVVVIGLSANDIDELNIQSDYNMTVASLINKLYEDENNQPAVVGIDLQINISVDDNNNLALISACQERNVVFSSSLDFEDNAVVFDDGVTSKELKIKKESKPYLYNSVNYGYNNVIIDNDGHVRHYSYAIKIDDERYSKSFAGECYDAYCEALNIESNINNISLSEDYLFYINFINEPNTYYSYYASDILNGNFDSSILKDKVVLFGACDSTIDSGYSPANDYNDIIYNVEVQANAIENLINDYDIFEVPILNQLLTLMVISAFMIYLLMKTNFLVVLISYASVTTIDFVFSPILWKFAKATIHPLFYFSTLTLIIIIGLVVYIIKQIQERERISEVVERYIDKGVYNKALLNEEEFGLFHRDKKNITVLFADVRDFTTITENTTPVQIVEILNEYLSLAGECITNNGGMIDKYIGDCVMGLWGATDEVSDGPFLACKAARDIVDKSKALEEKSYKLFGRPLSFGIGINYGEAIVGNIGSPEHMAYTAIGDTVNIASRVESISPKNTVYITDIVYKLLEGRGKTTQLDRKYQAKGKSRAIDVYRLEGLNDQKGYYQTDYKNKLLKVETTGEHNYAMHVLGCRGSMPVTGGEFVEFGGETTCYIVKTKKHALVIDCGTGLYNAKPLLSDCDTIDVILTHVHYDHLLGILSWKGIVPDGAKVTIYGNFDKWRGDKTLSDFFSAPYWPIDPKIDNLKQIPAYGSSLDLGDGIVLDFYKATHPNDTSLLKIMLGNKRIVAMFDSESSKDIPFEECFDSDMIIYDGMFTDEEYPAHKGWGHSTWQSGVRLALKANPKMLLITHHNTRSTDYELEEKERKAKEIFGSTRFARTGDIYYF